MEEREWQIEREGFVLAATACGLDAAGPPRPVVVFVHGSGPVDRDENTPKLRINAFKVLAGALAELGIPSLRYDKRGCGLSSGDYQRAGHLDLVDDALAVCDALAAHPTIAPDGIVVVGHSEGTVIGAQLAARRRLAGLVVLCPYIEPFGAMLRRQARQQIDQLRREQPWRWRAVRLGDQIGLGPLAAHRRLLRLVAASDRDVMVSRGVPFNARWVREKMALDLPALWRAVDCPLLAIGGAKDVQCLPGDASLVAEAVQGGAESLLVDDMNHILRLDPAGDGRVARYPALLEQPLAPTLIDRLTQWVKTTVHR